MASLVRKCVTLLRAPVNSVSFAARQAVRWGRGCPPLVNEDKAELFDYLAGSDRIAADARERQLCEHHDLEPLRGMSTRLDYRDNLWLLDSMTHLLRDVQLPLPRGVLRVMDIGAKNWSYVFALDRFFRSDYPGRQEVELVGVEIDGHGIYRDFHSRADHARAYVAQVGNSRIDYRVADFLSLPIGEPLDVVTLFYPFLTRHALLTWGLPLRHFRPDRILARALEHLRPGGLMVVFNQTSRERDLLHGMLRDLGVAPTASMPLRSKLVGYWHQTQDRWGTVIRRPAVA